MDTELDSSALGPGSSLPTTLQYCLGALWCESQTCANHTPVCTLRAEYLQGCTCTRVVGVFMCAAHAPLLGLTENVTK